MRRTNQARDDKLMGYFNDEYLDAITALATKRPKPTETTHDKWTDDNGVDWWVHRWNKACTEDGCAIHAPTDHRMIDWPQIMAAGTLVVRLCEHDVEHPDPDSLAFFKRRGQDHMGVHNCDGCCSQRPKPRGGETRTVDTVTYPVAKHTSPMHDCEICCER